MDDLTGHPKINLRTDWEGFEEDYWLRTPSQLSILVGRSYLPCIIIHMKDVRLIANALLTCVSVAGSFFLFCSALSGVKVNRGYVR